MQIDNQPCLETELIDLWDVDKNGNGFSSKTWRYRVHCSSDTFRLMRSRLSIIAQVDDTAISLKEVKYVEVYMPAAKWK